MASSVLQLGSWSSQCLRQYGPRSLQAAPFLFGAAPQPEWQTCLHLEEPRFGFCLAGPKLPAAAVSLLELCWLCVCALGCRSLSCSLRTEDLFCSTCGFCLSFFRVFTVWGYRSGAVSSCCRLLDISLCLSLVQPFFHRLSTRSPAYLPRCCFALYQRTQGSFPKLILNTFRTLGEGKKQLKLAPTQVLGTTFRQRALKMHLTVQIAKTQTAGVTCVHSAHAPCVSCAVVGCCPVHVVFPRLPLVHLPGTELSGVSQAALKRRVLLACSPAEKCCALQLCTGFKGCDLVCKSELIPARGRASSWLCWDKEGLAFAFRGERGFQAARKVGGGNPLRCYLLWFCLEC